jgi:nitrate/nitrite transporter NarK
MSLIVIGAYLVTFLDYKMMLIGRLLIGLGAESFYVVMNKIVTKWFKDKQLAMAFGLNLLLCRLGSIAAFNFLPWVVKSYSIKSALWVSALLTIIGFLLTIVYCLVDRRGDKMKYVAQVENQEEVPFRLRDAIKLPAAFWIITLLCVTYYSTIFPFTGVSKDFFYQHYGMDEIAGGRLSSIILIISMAVTWIFGLVIDKIGKRATLMIIGSVMMIPCHVSMAFTSVPPIIPMIVLGLSFSLVPAALWPAVPLIVKENYLGTAYGIIFMIQNIGLLIFEPLAGHLFDVSGNYKLSMVMFSVLGVIGLGFAIWLKILEKKGGGYLDTKETRVL